jgi:flagellar hook assembly protein FlgD
LDIFDISGQHIINLRNGLSDAGIHEIEWDGKNTDGMTLPAGIYFYTLSFENTNLSHKMVLLK